MAAGTRTSLPYNPALDGVRGLAIIAVLLFHSGFPWARGGYLGVSTFFTLSGFLITSLLLDEHRRHGRIDLSAFWSRRVRRLLPAATLTLGALAVSILVTTQPWERNLPGDVVAAALQVANWRYLFEDRAYSDLFAAPSPALHFWSLAIEEQFYWVFPLVAAGVLGVARSERPAAQRQERDRRSVRVFGVVLAGLVILAAGLTFAFRDSPSTVYYATPIRMGEILIGALLAVVLAGGRLERVGPRLRGTAGVLGAVGLAVSAWAWWNVEQTSTLVAQGGLLAYALVSAAVVLAASVPGPVRRALSFSPLRLLGLVSYGVYLFHWPLFLVLDAAHLDRLLARGPVDVHLRGWSLFAVRMAVVLALAVVSYRWVESPIRRGWRPKVPAVQVVAVSGIAAVLLTAFALPRVSPPPPDPFADYIAAAAGPDPAFVPPDASVGVVVGDSTVMSAAWGLEGWGRDQGFPLVLVGGSADVGCSIGDEGEVEYRGVKAELRGDTCDTWKERLLASIGTNRERYGHVDFAVVQTGLWDVANRRIPGHDDWVHIGQDVYDEYLLREMNEVVDLLRAEGVTTVWLTSPLPDWTLVPDLTERPPEFDPVRMERYNALIRGLADRREDVVAVDLAAYAAGLPAPDLARLRGDGIHWTFEGSREVAEWLGPQVMLHAVAGDGNGNGAEVEGAAASR